MSSPIEWGNHTSSIILSKDIDIKSESIDITIDKTLKKCRYEITYNIESDTINVILPLAFLALDYEKDFQVYIDGIPHTEPECDDCEILDLPNEHLSNTPLSFSKHSFFDYKLNKLISFNIKLTKKDHEIKVIYESNVWVDKTDWVKKYSFRYSLEPAKYWKSFHNLTVKVNQTEINFTSNLGQPNKTNDTVQTWEFNKLPGDQLILSYTPNTNIIIKALILISPTGLTFIFMILCILYHYNQIKNLREPKKFKSFTLPSFALSFLVYLFYNFIFHFIDLLIGEHASRHHGYIFLTIIFYPIVFLLHLLILQLLIKKKNSLQHTV